jgi:ATP-dependent DNA helicase RecQ
VDLKPFLASFGLTAFRPGQEEVISAVLTGEDCLCVMPTGSGKSLCYQLPAVAREGVVLVVSPLIALMKDQVDQLLARGMRATFINSTLDPAEQTERLRRVAGGEYDLVYVVPERFRSPRFLEAVERCRLQLLAVDEAHCISEWGHDFRPDYTRLGMFRSRIGDPTTIALTATATQTVRDDIVRQLGLKSPRVFITGFSRPNLEYEVQHPSGTQEKDHMLREFLDQTPGSGIIYVSARKRTIEVAVTVTQATGRAAIPYHAGMTPDERRQAQDSFMKGETPIIVATTAFGMGIDKPDVRFVVHYNLPGSIEAYYQEAGRAGRDGQPSRCLMLYSASDRYVQDYFIESAYPSKDVVERVFDFLRMHPDDPIEITQQDLKDQLKLDISPDGVGTCEQLLEKAGVLERLEARQNMAAVRLSSDLPTLVDLLPPQATARRKVLRAVERMAGPRRNELVYFHPHELDVEEGIDPSSVLRVLRELNALDVFHYVPPFRGRAISMLDRRRRFSELPIDFEALEKRKQAEYEKVDRLIRFAQTRRCRQRDILRYFGEATDEPCGHCDNCRQHPRQANALRLDADPAARSELIRKVLSGVARARGRFGKTAVAQMLKGSQSSRMGRGGLDQLSTFGILTHLRLDQIGTLLDAMIEAGYAEQYENQPRRPLIRLTPLGEDVMREKLPPDNVDLPASIPLPRRRSAPQAGLSPSPPASKSSGPTSARPANPPGARPAAAAGHSQATPPDATAPWYWTWVLLNRGYTPAQCSAIRNMTSRQVLQDALAAADAGWQVELTWWVSEERAAELERDGKGLVGSLDFPHSAHNADGASNEFIWFDKCRQKSGGPT